MKGRAIILIGPPGAGKSTIAEALSARLGIPRAALDHIGKDYYREAGYSDELAQELRQKGGFLSLVFYWQLYTLHAVRRVLEDHPESVIDFGAGHSVLENRFDFESLRALLEPYPNVFLILPSPDPEESIRVLHERMAHLVGTRAQGFDWPSYFVRHPANALLAKHTVYTEGKTPEAVCEAICGLLAPEKKE